ncbi:uncharacterized protein LOC121050830 [Rosa chinensis]|uniref:uncharacterized protein LOC121050830 n=1 Tax=Rosa chinensis TaxID=74649 RepID=UPI001AD92D14|nr:uncharacterized protein LOC121050830 [Rosa chinensis]XP_040368069.1 uncharacterized protein LOC121050830 [Rosa chinensis]
MKAFLIAVTGFIAAIVAWYDCKLFIKRELLPDWDELRRFYLNQLSGSEVECMENLRVSIYGFSKLCEVLYDKGGLRRTRHVSIEESVAIFLNILGHDVKYRSIHLNFYRSKETISRQFNGVLHAVMRTSKEYVRFHDCVLQGVDLRRWRWFENCLGALDGTHVSVIVRAVERPRYRNRKGYISSNVLGACNPNMRFIYVLLGWEGSASDSRVLRDALSRHGPLVIPMINITLSMRDILIDLTF